jgi:hypothetical protein
MDGCTTMDEKGASKAKSSMASKRCAMRRKPKSRGLLSATNFKKSFGSRGARLAVDFADYLLVRLRSVRHTIQPVSTTTGTVARLSLAFASWEVGREKREGERVVE